MNLINFTDEALDTLRTDVLNEQERRQRLASTPAQVAALASRYMEDGGDPSLLSFGELGSAAARSS